MSFFMVSAGDLQIASAVLSSPEPLVLGSEGGAAGTPLAGAWSEFVERADAALRDTHAAVDGLSRSLSVAARAYEWADQSSAAPFEGAG
jgi:Excreted virulence factor EspC, type VII ESX diderm